MEVLYKKIKIRFLNVKMTENDNFRANAKNSFLDQKFKKNGIKSLIFNDSKLIV